MNGHAQWQIGILFDWDGVVVDSSARHEESWDRLAAEENLPLFPGHFKKGFGRKNEYIIPHILKWTEKDSEINRLSQRKELLYRIILKEKGILPIPGVESFLKQLWEAKIPCAVGSSTHRENIQLALELLDFKKYFSGIISSENVSRGKPDPQVFLEGARFLGLKPENCVVIEDAVVGIEAARAGGMKVIAVTNTHPETHLRTAHRVVSNLNQIKVEELTALIRE